MQGKATNVPSSHALERIMFLKGSLKVVWVLSNDTTQALDLANLCKCICQARKSIRFYWVGHQNYMKEYLGYDCPCVSSNIPIHPCSFYGAIFYGTLNYLSRIVGGKLNLHCFGNLNSHGCMEWYSEHP